MEDSDSKRNSLVESFAQNEEARVLKELQALMSCAVPTDLLMSLLQSQMLSHSNNDIHQSIAHLLISYSGKRGTIANITILPLDLAQIIRYLFGVSIAVVNCTQHTTLKDLCTKLSVHSSVNYKEWTQQVQHKLVTNANRNMAESDGSKSKDVSPKLSETILAKDTQDSDEINTNILILSDPPSNTRNSNINIISPQSHLAHDHEESHNSHSSLFVEQSQYQNNVSGHNRRLLSTTDGNTPLKRYLTEPTLSKTSPSATPPPNEEKEHKERVTDNGKDKEPPFGYGIKEEQVVTTKFHNNHFYKHRERDHLSNSIHSLHKLQHSQSTGTEYLTPLNSKSLEIPSKAVSKYKLDCISCQVILFHNIHKLTRAMQSIVIQIMKMKSIPTPDHNTHVRTAPAQQLCILTRQYNKTIPYMLRDLCLTDYVISSKKCLKKMHKFIGFDLNEHKQSYYSHVTGISFDGSADNKFKISHLTQYDNTLVVPYYNAVQSQSPSMASPNAISGLATGPMKLKDTINAITIDMSDANAYGLFPVSRLKILYSLVNEVFIHNSIAQYIRDIIIAIRLHPDVKQGCSSFRANEALNISAKFTNFMSRLGERYKRLRISNKYIDQLIAKVHFVRPKDVDSMAIQILSHRIDIIANEYSPSLSENKNKNIRNGVHSIKKQKFRDIPFSEIEPMKSFQSLRDRKSHRSESSQDNSDEKGNDELDRKRSDFSNKARAEILKQLRLDPINRRRGGGYRTGSMSLPRTPRVKRSVSLTSINHDELEKLNRYKHKKAEYRKRRKSKNRSGIDVISVKENDIDIEDFEFEVFSDSDDYSMDEIDEEYEYLGMEDDDEEYGDDGGGSGRGDYDEINDEYDEYEDGFIEDNMEVNNEYLGSKRNSNRGQYSLVNETNEKKLSIEQRLVYNLLRRVLLPPK